MPTVAYIRLIRTAVGRVAKRHLIILPLSFPTSFFTFGPYSNQKLLLHQAQS